MGIISRCLNTLLASVSQQSRLCYASRRNGKIKIQLIRYLYILLHSQQENGRGNARLQCLQEGIRQRGEEAEIPAVSPPHALSSVPQSGK